MKLYKLSDDGETAEAVDANAYTAWVTEIAKDHEVAFQKLKVADDEFTDNEGTAVRVATDFVMFTLVNDRYPTPPFESQVFGGSHHLWQRRYWTRTDALAGHKMIRLTLQHGQDPEGLNPE